MPYYGGGGYVNEDQIEENYHQNVGQAEAAGQQYARSGVLTALEQAYREALAQSTQSAEERARAAGTWSNTAEFAQGLQDEAGLQARGAQAALLPRINALRQQAGIPAFNPNNANDPLNIVGPYRGDMQSFMNSADAATRAAIMHELEAAYSGVGQNVATAFANQGQVGADFDQSGNTDYSNPDNVRLLQSQVASGTTGANNAFQARINALRNSLNLEQFSAPMTPGQQYVQAGQNAQTAAGQASQTYSGAPSTAANAVHPPSPSSDPSDAVNVDDSGETVDTSDQAKTQQNAVTAASAPNASGARKRTAPRMV